MKKKTFLLTMLLLACFIAAACATDNQPVVDDTSITRVDDVFDIGYYQEWKGAKGASGSQVFAEDKALRVHLGFRYGGADYAPLLTYDWTQNLTIRSTNIEWLVLWSSADQTKHIAVNLKTSIDIFGNIALFNLNSIEKQSTKKLKSIDADAKPYTPGEYINIAYDEQQNSYRVSNRDGGQVLFEFSFDDIADQFAEMEDIKQRIGFLHKNDVAMLAVYTLRDIAQTSQLSDKYVGKKWLAIGDSITARGAGYLCEVASNLGIEEYYNAGIGGALVTKRGGQTHDINHRIENGVFTTYPPVDLITIFAGTNDFNAGIPLGTKDSTSPNDFGGAVNFMLDYFINNFPNSELVVFTPTYRSVQHKYGQEFMDFVNLLKVICADKGVKIIDMTQCGINESNWQENLSDPVHPNEEGYKVMAPYMAKNLAE